MKIKSLHLFRLQVPLRVRFSQSNNTTATSDSAILRLETTSGLTSYGECCPRPYVTGEDFTSVKNDIQNLTPHLTNLTFRSFEQIRQLLTIDLLSQVGLSTLCALDLALLDAWSKAQQLPLSQVLGVQLPQKIKYAGVIPIAEAAKLRPLAEKFSQFAFQDIKVKVGTDLHQALETIHLVKQYWPQVANIRIDANCAWTPRIAQSMIPPLLQAGVTTFEQIFPKGKTDALADITQQFGRKAEIMEDESLTSFASARQLIAQKACNRFNIKLSKTGGILNALRIYDLAKAHHINCQLGAHFGETSLLTAAGIWFSATAPELKTHEGAMGTYLLEQDLMETPLQFDKEASLYPLQQIPDKPGLQTGKVNTSMLQGL